MNVYAEAVESVLERHPDVLEAAVVGTDHDEWGTAVEAGIRASSDDLTAQELNRWYRDTDDLAKHQRPREYVLRESLPRTATGKVDRAALRD